MQIEVQLSEDQMKVLNELSEMMGLPPAKVLSQALAIYQTMHKGAPQNFEQKDSNV